MKIYKIKPRKKLKLKGQTPFEGNSIEFEMSQAMRTNQPISRSMSNLYYTNRKDGVIKECDIRTDRFDVALTAMEKANNQFKNLINEKINKKEEQKENKNIE